MLKVFWQGLNRTARVGLGVGVVTIVGATIAAAVWLLRTDYDVLFAGLSPADAAVMTAELDRMKLPYKLGADGASILVDRASVHGTRLKLLGKDLPLRGAVGFELFNNSDFGMTEFAQKINYQRALQGELTRTILSIAEVETARVHLAMPDEGLFRREQSRAKASVTLGLRRHQVLRPEQVSGIQRLIAAAVPGVAMHDVTIVDNQGVALTRASGGEDAATAGGNTRLDLKRDIEQHLARKANAVLERTFGSGQALTSVDVTLNLDQVRVTTEDVTTPASKKGEPAVGVVVRERETIKEEGVSAAGRRDAGAAATGPGSSHREIEYQVGRRVEQVVSQPGSIERLQVVAVIQAALKPGQIEQLRALVGAAVGLSPARGDVIVVQSMESLVGTLPRAATADDLAVAMPLVASSAPTASARPEAARSGSSSNVVTALAVLLGCTAVGAIVVQHRRVRPSAPTDGALTEAQRVQALARVQQWLTEAPHGR